MDDGEWKYHWRGLAGDVDMKIWGDGADEVCAERYGDAVGDRYRVLVLEHEVGYCATDEENEEAKEAREAGDGDNVVGEGDEG